MQRIFIVAGLAVLLAVLSPKVAAQQQADSASGLLANWADTFDQNKTRVRKPLDDLDDKFRLALERLKSDSAKTGSLDKVLAVNKALAALQEGNTETPWADPDAEKLRGIYLKQQALIAKQLAPQVGKIVLEYADNLKAITVPLTQMGRIDEATLVNKQRNDLLSLFSNPQLPSSFAEDMVAPVLHAKAGKQTKAVVWGNDNFGQSHPPSEAADLTAVAGGIDFSVGLRSDGSVIFWGNPQSRVNNIPAGLTGVTALRAGVRHCVALRSNGTLVGWGDNGEGQNNIPEGLVGVIAVDAKNGHDLALKSDGTVVAWGRNRSGQCNVPPGLSEVIAIAAGGEHSVAVKRDGTVVAWGANNLGQCEVPKGLQHAVAVAAGSFHSLALLANGTVVGWGHNALGQATPPAGLSGVKAIAANGWHSAALKSDGTVVAWGNNSHGQINVPADLRNVMAIQCGLYHTLAVTQSGGYTSVKRPTHALTLHLQVDGADVIHIKNGELWIDHESWKKPDEISLNGVKWQPVWQNNKSDVFRSFDAPLAPFNGAEVKIVQRIGRGNTAVVDLPSETNGQTLSFRIDDPKGGSDIYEVHVSW